MTGVSGSVTLSGEVRNISGWNINSPMFAVPKIESFRWRGFRAKVTGTRWTDDGYIEYSVVWFRKPHYGRKRAERRNRWRHE